MLEHIITFQQETLIVYLNKGWLWKVKGLLAMEEKNGLKWSETEYLNTLSLILGAD
jgi:hypothetical protein